MRVLLIVLLILPIFCMPTLAQAVEESDARMFFDRVNSSLSDPIPKLSELLPSYSRPQRTYPGLIIGVFKGSGDGDNGWPILLSEIIRINLSSLPSARVDTGDLDLKRLQYDARSNYFRAHAFVDLTDFKNLVTLSERYGIRKILTGSVQVKNNVFNINLSINDLETDEQISSDYLFESKNLNSQLAVMLEWIYRQLGNVESADLVQIRRGGPDKQGLLMEFSSFLQDNYLNRNRQFPEYLVTQLEQESNFPLAHFYHISHQADGNSVAEYNSKIETIAAKYPDFRAIQIVANLAYRHLGQAGLLQTKILGLKNALASYPTDYFAIIELTVSLVKNKQPLEALALAQEIVLRWPERHRSWRNLSYVLRHLAWDYRGTGYWNEVPENRRNLFKELLAYSKDAIDISIQLHPASGEAYGDRISLYGGYSAGVLQDLKNAVQYDPGLAYIYKDALYFSSDSWGGGTIIQKKIYQIAEENHISEYLLDDLWYQYIEPDLGPSSKLLHKYLAQLGLPVRSTRWNDISSVKFNKKSLFWLGIVGIFIFGSFYHWHLNQRKQEQELISAKFNDLWAKLNSLKVNLRVGRKKLIVEKHGNWIVLPQIDQYYSIINTPNGLKINSHLGLIYGDIEEASATVLEEIKTEINRL